jgi:hypothetical protein
LTPVTLVLQFKRPEYLYGATAGQWRFWHQPYFRFARLTEQQRVLATLERNAGENALVRYAAPALWQRGHLEAAHLRGEVIQARRAKISSLGCSIGLANQLTWCQATLSVSTSDMLGRPLDVRRARLFACGSNGGKATCVNASLNSRLRPYVA